MPIGRVNVRANGAQSGAIGRTEPVAGMDTIDGYRIVNRGQDLTVTLSDNTGGATSGLVVKAEDVFIFASEASGAGKGGSWPSGVNDQEFNWRAKAFRTTTH